MFNLARNNRSFLAQWWWTVDRLVLLAVLCLMGMGVFLVMAASPAVADQHSWSSFYFVKKHLIFLLPALGIMLAASCLAPNQVRKLAVVCFAGGIIALLLTLVVGVEIKGARRWLEIAGFSLQPSEFIKPFFAVLSAWLFSLQHETQTFPGNKASFALYVLVIALLLLQPDLGMTLLVTAIWLTQFFLAGLPLYFIVGAVALGVLGAVGAYFSFSHVHKRVDQFLDPSVGDRFGDRYQVSQSLDAFMNGGFFGMGPGEGIVKKNLPDAHADFIFAVAGEEFGLVLCLLIVTLFAFIVVRSLGRALAENNLYVILAVAGLSVQFGLQSLINIASTLNLMPTKGMTLPFISYGGSSLVALALGMGLLLALTRRRVGA